MARAVAAVSHGWRERESSQLNVACFATLTNAGDPDYPPSKAETGTYPTIDIKWSGVFTATISLFKPGRQAPCCFMTKHFLKTAWPVLVTSPGFDESQSNWTQQRSVVTPIRRSTHVGVVGNTEVHMQFLDHLDP